VPVCLALRATAVDTEPQAGVGGICVANIDHQGNIRATVRDVSVTGFTVWGFPGMGIVFFGTSGIRAEHDVAAHNHDYGITAFVSTHAHQRSIPVTISPQTGGRPIVKTIAALGGDRFALA
jgi:hypothetical protein